MRKFKFKKDQWVNFTVDGEKHLGQIVSGCVLAAPIEFPDLDVREDYISYCVSDCSDASMWDVRENELTVAPEQELRDRLLESFTNSLWGTPKKKSNITETEEVSL